MNRVTIDLDALHQNLDTVQGWVKEHRASLTVVTKALCGHRESLEGLFTLGVRSVADSRLEHLEKIRSWNQDVETWYLRPPHFSALGDLVRTADISLNSELEVITEINEEARRQGRVHGVVIMIELGDLREGVLPGALVKTYREVFHLENIRVLGVGANLGCLSGTVPSVDQLMQLVLYRELLELKFAQRLPLVSAGSSVILPLLLEGALPRPINHFRIGESILLGTDLVNEETLQGLRDDVVTVESEIVEIKEKSLIPLGETTDLQPFEGPENEEELAPGQRGYRALVTIGQVDTDVGALRPVNPDFHIAGASSDLTVVNVGEDRAGLGVGDTISFRTGYSALVRLMSNIYTEKAVTGPSAAVREAASGITVPPVAER